MASALFDPPSIGEVTISPEMGCELEWKIPDFVSLLDKDHHFSPTFSFAGMIWRMIIDVKRESIHVGIVRESTIPPISLEVSVGFKTLDGKKDRERSATRHVMRSGDEGYVCSSCLQKTDLLERKSDLLPSNVLTLLVVLKLQKSAEDADEPCTSASSNVLHKNQLQHDFKELFLNKENCDVVLKVQGQEFQAHKVILQARSPVLASTFRNDMKEKATGVVDIEDCDPSSFANFLCFLYCGDMEVISKENVFSLFTTADKYDVQDLRAQCLKFVMENISVDTFCDTLTLALRHSEQELINLATEFFVKNAIEIIKTAKWQSFLDENATVGNELFLKFASSSSNSSK